MGKMCIGLISPIRCWFFILTIYIYNQVSKKLHIFCLIVFSFIKYGWFGKTLFEQVCKLCLHLEYIFSRDNLIFLIFPNNIIMRIVIKGLGICDEVMKE